MRTFRLHQPQPVETAPLRAEEMPRPEPGPRSLLVRIHACGVCHTDLHTVEGEIVPPAYPITPGHQVAGTVEAIGDDGQGWNVGDRVGVPWLHQACGECAFCARGEENLCPHARFTGFHVDGGYAEYLIADARYALPLPPSLDDQHAAPLLCAGIIGYRSLRKADLRPGEHLGLAGFGASAHLTIQLARHWGCLVSVFTRNASHRDLARRLGASWVGSYDDPLPEPLDRAVLFAPVGALVPKLLEKLRAGGTLAINAIHASPIPEMPYAAIYGEKTVRSVANATRQDGVEFLRLAAEIPIRPVIQTYPLDAANRALLDLKQGCINGAAVLLP
ncbi:MAG: zinc-dependent alcohol dehydrogenase family protein [Chloroflexota bacterium]